ncbi:GntR family transcriptional regulator [Croceicoccus ponticola]|uniref:GntR family transcriptional regulator n=1 Tax=Croceicoccus ponticola TaxID=2217664 RepID=UPI00196A85E2|nr:GntR family transcriptional regulator [Croceicoccus ponticola]
MKLAEKIEDIILTGELPAGSKLDEMVLARRFNVSRTPIREALRHLASTGMVDLIPNRGAFIATLTPEQLHEMFVAMAEMEATCARLAAISMTPPERQNLQRLHDRMAQAIEPNDFFEFGEMNNAFHLMIYRGAHNHYLEQATTKLRQRLSLYRRSQFRTKSRLANSFAEHDAVTKAILSGDPVNAHAAMLRHVDNVEISVKTLLGQSDEAPS